MRLSRILPATLMGLLLTAGCSKKESYLEVSYPDFEGEKVELISYRDSTILGTSVIRQGEAKFDNSEAIADGPLLAQVVIDGRIKGFAVLEEGTARLVDSLSVASGTPLNDDFARQIAQMDSVENLNDMIAYAAFAEKKYNDNKSSVLGDYFGVEYMKYGEPKAVLKMLKEAPENFRESRPARKYARYAELRARTAVGEKYVDFTAPQADGSAQKLSQYVKPGVYTLVDFWASWCPYCIKELPELKELYTRYHGSKGLEIVGVAVRDTPEDTKGAVERHGISWPVISNAQRVPYDIYGFSGIPHLMLIGPDGRIVARGESAAQTAARLEKIYR